MREEALLEQRGIRPGDLVRHFKRETLSEEEKKTNRYLYRVLGVAPGSLQGPCPCLRGRWTARSTRTFGRSTGLRRSEGGKTDLEEKQISRNLTLPRWTKTKQGARVSESMKNEKR